MKQNKIYFLLSMYCIHYPILKKMGYDISRPIVLFVRDIDKAKSLIEKIFFRPIICTPQMGVPAMKKKVKQSNSRGIFLICSKADSQKEQEKLDILNGIAMYSEVDDFEVSAATFVVTDSSLFCREGQIVINVCLNSNQDVAIDFYRLIPNAEQMGKIVSEIKMISEEEKATYPLLPLMYFLRPVLQDVGMQNVYADVCKEIRSMILRTNAESVEEKLEEIIDCIFYYADNGGFLDCYKLPCLETGVMEKIDKVCFEKGNILYVSDEKFEDIFATIEDRIELIEIKRVMKDCGLLKCYQTGFKKKMNWYNAYGKDNRTPMLALCTDKIKDAYGTPLKYYIN